MQRSLYVTGPERTGFCLAECIIEAYLVVPHPHNSEKLLKTPHTNYGITRWVSLHLNLNIRIKHVYFAASLTPRTVPLRISSPPRHHDSPTRRDDPQFLQLLLYSKLEACTGGRSMLKTTNREWSAVSEKVARCRVNGLCIGSTTIA